ncbi:hypothetical protein M2132_001823 [Dysgonomonas sp. PH5-45]|uniref:hypothetical protein n=1 Tax=unclassified Dysgonomonas TaxID=2630389 RepID=UPI0024743083|nr:MULTISPECIES: hypothetical protein [unclassified Dysgonomonas]MDH6355480.1 hypothetical protein [Dysgonomonas sp. PH5-45]MDH6388376.1 hypothetical protein [Dysgonomonas sp. PH5-37]
MDKYGWRDIDSFFGLSEATYYSKLGRANATGSASDPYNERKVITLSANRQDFVFGTGEYNCLLTHTASGNGNNLGVYGQGKELTTLSLVKTKDWQMPYFSDMRIKSLSGNSTYGNTFRNCIFDKNYTSWYVNGMLIATNCIFYTLSLAGTSQTFVQSTCVDVTYTNVYNVHSCALFSKCNIVIPDSTFLNNNNVKNYYEAFNNCKFQIGTEPEATLLVGNTADEVRQNFVDRCTAQGFTVPAYTEYGGTNVPMGRWIFSNNSIAGDYDVIEGSDIDAFAKQRGIYFGYSSQTVKPIAISADGTAAASFNADSPKENISLSDNSITLDGDTTIRNEGYIDSNIIWLGGLRKLNMLNISHNLPVDSGVAVDSTFAFGHKLDKIDGVNESLNQPFDGITVAVPVQMSTTATPEAIVFCKGMFAGQNTFAAKVGDTYYNNWVGRDNYADGNGKPLTDRLFVHNDQKYYWDGSKMIEANTSIEPDTMYIVRSDDNNEATVTYNGTAYSSSLATRNNVFMGVSGVESFTPSSNAVILPVRDVINYQTVQLRIVESIPGDKITSGSLSSGYWYFVTPDSMGDTSGTVTYNGKTYPCLSSFLATDTTAFTINGACHLRRCWNQDFDFGMETQDVEFWADKQKPYWVDINPDDLRCMHKNNSPSVNEMKTDDKGNYIASGHPLFYPELTGVNGIKSPAFGIMGAFMQIRIIISTLNTM